MNDKKDHFAAIFTIFLWGTTFISTKFLLVDFLPIEILWIRFVIGFLMLCLVCPKRFRIIDHRQEKYFALAGLCGICLYYLLENIALTYTSASNVGVIISIAPFFTAILARVFKVEQEPLHPQFFIGFIAAIVGISIISFNGTTLSLNPKGDILAILAAFLWACYSIVTRKISTFSYPTILVTRRIFSYGILCMLPCFFLFPTTWPLEKFAQPAILMNFLFLGIGASALCFVTWNYAVKVLGAIRTSIYIYLVPVITVLASFLFLQEKLTMLSFLGTLLTILGLGLSEGKSKKKREISYESTN